MTYLSLVTPRADDGSAPVSWADMPPPALTLVHGDGDGDAVGGRPPTDPQVRRPCVACLRRTWLIASLAGRIEIARRAHAGRLRRLLALSDRELIHAVGAETTEVPERYRRFDPQAAVAACARAAVTPICRHDERYPDRLHELEDPPAMLHVAGAIERFGTLVAPDRRTVAIVGARRASEYGLEVARGLGRGLAGAGVTVVSGMALGVDSAAHDGALAARGPTVAVLAGSADRPYPSSKRSLHAALVADHAVVSELPPGASAHRWCFPARNRIIAALGEVTVVVEAAARSGSLITAELARDLGRDVAAVPGRLTSPLAGGVNALLKDGAHVLTSTDDALDLLFGVGGGRVPLGVAAVAPHLADLFAAVAAGRDSAEALADEAGRPIGSILADLAELELDGHLHRGAGGRYVPTM